ncbi:hypothetical protein PGT21_025701 [Puccinia graminis f. sp. tritici]|uniref:Uncharacterized protein n=1 Tax=Puccinia graminis f. sp. tritici TaxID=56615 RepID=A0A5B0MTV3_PUCGR|nr:hypothetical protein PGT21_025701 [Puccinia graminis f. sp. tritici]
MSTAEKVVGRSGLSSSGLSATTINNDEEELCDEDNHENSDNDSDFNNHSKITPSLGNSDTISGILT